jgi:hypothetical protein
LSEPLPTRHDRVQFGEPPPTRHDPVPASGAPPTRLDGVAPATRLDPNSAAEMSSAGGLPDVLRRRFDPVENLGDGGEAHLVLRVRDRADGAERVIKLYRGAVDHNSELAASLLATNSRHVAKVIERDEYTDGLGVRASWEIMEYLPAGPLTALIREEGPQLPPDLVREVVRQLAEALNYLHRHVGTGGVAGLAHRDVKPANVLLRSREPLELVLADFGLVAEIRHTTQLTGVGGTAAYQAPETFVGRSREAAQDWWSLGIMVVEMLTGRNPNTGTDGRDLPIAALFRHLTTHDVDLTGVTDDRWRLLARGLLTRAPEHRWGYAEVTSWLGGGSPLVHADLAGPGATTAPAPIDFAGQPYHRVPDLARAMAANWPAAIDALQAPDRCADLREWLAEHFGGAGIPAEILRRPAPNPDVATPMLVRFLRYATPDDPPVLHGRQADVPGLAALAADAIAGDNRASAILRAVTGDVLTQLAKHRCVLAGRERTHTRCGPAGTGCRVLATAAGALDEARRVLAERAAALPGVVQALDGTTAPALTGALRTITDGSPNAHAMLLGVLVDRRFRARLLRHADVRLRARGRPWWADLRRDVRGADPTRAAAALVLATVTAAAARAEATAAAAGHRTRNGMAARGVVRAVRGDLVSLLMAVVIGYLTTFGAGTTYQMLTHDYSTELAPEYATQVAGWQWAVSIPLVVLLACLLIRPVRPARALAGAVLVACVVAALPVLARWRGLDRWTTFPYLPGDPVPEWLAAIARVWREWFVIAGFAGLAFALALAGFLCARAYRTPPATRRPLARALRLTIICAVLALQVGYALQLDMGDLVPPVPAVLW